MWETLQLIDTCRSFMFIEQNWIELRGSVSSIQRRGLSVRCAWIPRLNVSIFEFIWMCILNFWV